ncbi:MAG: hypothetical protein NTY38_11155, partial [Acidobacteria bacterium]|nr:hypothetical protein [Acidobacteriota bacterium]
MKFGTERKKIALLGGLLLAAAYFLFFNGSEDERAANTNAETAPAVATAPRAAARSANPAPPNIRRAASRGNSRVSGGGSDFKPSLKPKRPEDRPDPTTVDPTLRLDVLAKVQQVKVEGGERSLFDFSTPPPKPAGPAEAKIHAKTSAVGSVAAVPSGPGAASTPLTPAASPIPLKFYGYLNPARLGVKRAFFLSGEDIFVAS